MNNITRKFFGSVLIFLITPLLISAEKGGGRKIVVFSDALNEQAKDELVSKHGGVKFKDLSLINGSAVWLPDTASEEALEQHAGILRIDDDIEVFALDRNNKANKAPAPSPSQTLPWGIDRIDAELVWPTGNTANPIKVGIIDTGISKDHPDLAVNIKGGVNTINPTKSWNDDNGHGSHVAGIAAALNNSLGVVGAGPNIDLYAIKVLNRNGSGFLSDVIEGIQWATANGIKVANMSLGSTSNVQSFHDAVIAAYNAGVTIVAAAGNSGGAVSFPAAYPEVIAVSATDINNNLASFSSRGPEIDLAAPGVSILSTYKGTSYATLSGTSMASPHVAGSAALVINSPIGAYDVNLNGKWDPAEVKQKLRDKAVDLGTTGFDNLFGWGLVNAFSAIQ